MEFYNPSIPLYMETYTSGIGLGPGLLQVRDGMNGEQDKCQAMQLYNKLLSPAKVC